MELSLPRNHKGKLWQLDKVRRWRSKDWRLWVRGLIPVKIERPLASFSSDPNGYDFGVIAAHFRYPGCGAGTKPADCFVYPMHDADHKEAHGDSQPDRLTQWQWVTETMLHGLKWGKLGAELNASNWIAELCADAMSGDSDLSTPWLEQVAEQWAAYFMIGDIRINKYTSGM